jgi:hypothetical protein
MWIFEFNSLTFTFHNAVDPRGEQPSIVVRALQYIHLVVNDLGTSYITSVIYTLQDQTKPNSLKNIQICNLPVTSSHTKPHTKLYNITQILHIHDKCNNMKCDCQGYFEDQPMICTWLVNNAPQKFNILGG